MFSIALANAKMSIKGEVAFLSRKSKISSHCFTNRSPKVSSCKNFVNAASTAADAVNSLHNCKKSITAADLDGAALTSVFIVINSLGHKHLNNTSLDVVFW